jgi:hypothetical protein
MLLRLLALFPVVARLLEDLSKSQSEIYTLQDRLNQVLNDRDRVWKEMQNALTGERHALHMCINIEYQRRYGIVPYPDDVKLPPAKDPGGPVTPKLTASQAVAQQTDKLIQELMTRRGA